MAVPVVPPPNLIQMVSVVIPAYAAADSQILDKWKDSLAGDLWVDESTRVLADMKKSP